MRGKSPIFLIYLGIFFLVLVCSFKTTTARAVSPDSLINLDESAKNLQSLIPSFDLSKLYQPSKVGSSAGHSSRNKIKFNLSSEELLANIRSYVLSGYENFQAVTISLNNANSPAVPSIAQTATPETPTPSPAVSPQSSSTNNRVTVSGDTTVVDINKIKNDLSVYSNIISETISVLKELSNRIAAIQSAPLAASSLVVYGQTATQTSYSTQPIVTSGSDHFSANYLNLANNATINGSLTVKSGGTFNTLSVSGATTLTGAATIGDTLNVTGDATLGRVAMNNASTTNLTVSGNAWINNGVITNASTTYATLPTFWGTTGNVTNLTITNASTTYATLPTFWSTNGTITNASTTYLTISNTLFGGNLLVGNATTTGLTVSGGSSLGSLIALNSSFSNATSTGGWSVSGGTQLNSLAFTVGTSTSFGVTGGAQLGALNVSGNTNLGNATTTGLTVSGGSSLGSLSALNVSFSNATTTGLTVQGGTSLGSLVFGAGTSTSLTVTGGTSLGSLGVTGLTNLADLIAGNATTTGLTVQGGTSLGSLVFGAGTSTSLTVTGGTSLGSLGVTGLTNLANLIAGNATTTGLTVTGGSSFNSITMSATSTMNGFNLCTSANGICASNLTGTTGQLAYFSGTNTAVGTSTLFISTAGNVGIASTSPSAVLSVNVSNATGNAAALNITSATSSLLFVRSDGNVGIGTTDPTATLHVVGTTKLFTGTGAGTQAIITADPGLVAIGRSASTNAIQMLNIGSNSTTAYDITGGAITNLFGVRIVPSLQLTGNQTNQYNLYVSANSMADGSARTLTNQYGAFIDAGAKDANTTVTNAYGLQVAMPTVGGTLNRAINVTGAGVAFQANNADSQLFLGTATDPGWGFPAIQMGNNAILSRSTLIQMASNAYNDGTADKYITTNVASRVVVNGNTITLETAPSGTAGNAITFTNLIQADHTSLVSLMFDDEVSNVAACYSGAELSADALRVIGDCTSGGADYAELYPVEQGIEYGEIVVLGDPSTALGAGGYKMIETYDTDEKGSPDPSKVLGSVPELKRSAKPYEANLMGVTVKNYSDFTLTGRNLPETSNTMPVALIGRVPVKVSTESGPIQIGDRITSSSLAGVGMKAATSGQTVGIALEPFDGSTAITTSIINSQEVKTGKILVFVNLGYSKLDDSVAQGTGDLASMTTTNSDLNLNSFSILNVKSITGMNGLWKIDEGGNLVVQDIKTQTISSAKGFTTYDEDTGQPYCIKIKGGQIVTAVGYCQDANTSNLVPASGTTQSPNQNTEQITNDPTATTTPSIDTITTATAASTEPVLISSEPLIATTTEPVVVSTDSTQPSPEEATAGTASSPQAATTTP